MAKLTLQELENLSHLLLSETDSNILLALEILENHHPSIPALSKELVLAWQLYEDDSLKLDIEALLKAHFSEEQILQWEKDFAVFRLLPSIYDYSPHVQRLIDDHEQVRSNYQTLIASNAAYSLHYYAIAKELHQHFEKHLELAEVYYKIALRSNPTHKNLLFHFAFLLYKHFDRYEEALEFYLRIEKIDPQSSSAINNIGLIYENTDQKELAYEYYSKLLALKPNSSRYLRHLARFCAYRMESAQYKQEAKELLQKLIKMAPDNGSNWNSWGNYLWTIEQNYKAAEQAYLKGLEVAPQNASLLGNLGELYIDVYQRYDEGLRLYQKALKLQASNYLLITSITVLVLHFKDYDNAQKYLQELIECSPLDQIERDEDLKDEQWNRFLEAKAILEHQTQ